MNTTTQADIDQIIQQALQEEMAREDRQHRAEILRRMAAKFEESSTEEAEGGEPRKSEPFKQAIPLILATFGAALIGASAPKGSALRYAGAVPGAIDLFAKARDNKDVNQVTIPLAAALAGVAGPMLIK